MKSFNIVIFFFVIVMKEHNRINMNMAKSNMSTKWGKRERRHRTNKNKSCCGQTLNNSQTHTMPLSVMPTHYRKTETTNATYEKENKCTPQGQYSSQAAKILIKLLTRPRGKQLLCIHFVHAYKQIRNSSFDNVYFVHPTDKPPFQFPTQSSEQPGDSSMTSECLRDDADFYQQTQPWIE